MIEAKKKKKKKVTQRNEDLNIDRSGSVDGSGGCGKMKITGANR